MLIYAIRRLRTWSSQLTGIAKELSLGGGVILRWYCLFCNEFEGNHCMTYLLFSLISHLPIPTAHFITNMNCLYGQYLLLKSVWSQICSKWLWLLVITQSFLPQSRVTSYFAHIINQLNEPLRTPASSVQMSQQLPYVSVKTPQHTTVYITHTGTMNVHGCCSNNYQMRKSRCSMALFCCCCFFLRDALCSSSVVHNDQAE